MVNKIESLRKPRKKRVGVPKYNITKLEKGESITLSIDSPADERRKRKSADNWNARNKGFIRARKTGDEITFTRVR